MAYNPLIKGEPDWHLKMNENMAGLEADIGKAKTAAVEEANQHADAAANGVKLGRNVFDNWYFGNPIDQRGGYVVPPNTSYYSDTTTGASPAGSVPVYHTAKIYNEWWVTITVNGTKYFVPRTSAVRGYVGGAEYTINRWKLSKGELGSCALTIEDDGVVLSTDAKYGCYFIQVIDTDIVKKLAGKTITLSVLTGDISGSFTGNIYINGAWNDYWGVGANRVSSKKYTIPANATNMTVQIAENGIGAGTCKIIAAKFELGSVQTLAHQDKEGNWILNEIPNYHEELLKCIQSTADHTDTYANKVIATGYTCNKNLLDNWYFRNPVDQREGYVVKPGVVYYNSNGAAAGTTDKYYKVDYISTDGYANAVFTINGTQYYTSKNNYVRGYTGATYTIDRWVMSSDGAVSFSNNGALVSRKVAGNNYGCFYERIESTTFLGKTMTFSAIVNGTLYKATGVIPNSIPSSGGGETVLKSNEVNGIWIQVHFTNNGLLEPGIVNFGDADCVAIAAKFEFGTEQTLAHQDKNGNWVLNEIPNYAEELVKCHRHNFRNSNSLICNAFATSVTSLYLDVVVPATMRATPAGFTSDIVLYGASGEKRFTGVTIAPYAVRGNHIMCVCQMSELTVGVSYAAEIYSPVFDANL